MLGKDDFFHHPGMIVILGHKYLQSLFRRRQLKLYRTLRAIRYFPK
jgi:hypothetical protein